ncbi:hypothetical protein Glove_518g18 [Diversispora epigaea]|uniref:C2H2-type domain-containing protein n=1 Tax=Diversispora epigaea TaxID=1348612 RepID=A0A397GF91_9GLOM|nr:hypothetical protein Glove_518g18 [Diversispora epigaea]
MSTQKSKTEILALGNIIENIHYGPFASNWWWFFRKKQKKTDILCIPFRINCCFWVKLNNHEFIVRIIKHNNNNFQPGFINESDPDTDVHFNITSAINFTYQKLFYTETRYSGLGILELDTLEIASQLLADVTFIPFQVKYENITLHIIKIGSSNNKEINYGGNDPDTDVHFNITSAINFTYQKLFYTETRYSGLGILELDTLEIASQLLADVTFIPFQVKYENITLHIIKIGSSNNKEINYGGNGYIATFIHKFRGDQCLVVQQIHENSFSITVYRNGIQREQVFGQSPEAVWKQMTIRQDNKPLELFGLCDPIVKQEIKNHIALPICTIKDWDNFEIMQPIFEKNLKKKISTINLGWIQFFLNWKNQKTRIIEFIITLAQIYPSDHQFTERELRAWRRMMKDVGCTNITPFSKDKSQLEFWTYASDFNIDREIIQNLYNDGFLKIKISIPSLNNLSQSYEVTPLNEQKFWNSFQKSLEKNKQCNELHNERCENCKQLFIVFQHLEQNLSSEHQQILEESKEKFTYFLAHQAWKKYLNSQYKAQLLDLNEDGAIMIADYKMKILPKSAREKKQEFFGKRGWSLHTILVLTKKTNNIEVQAFDHWSMDTKQDAWFTASSFDVIFETLDPKPTWIKILSDNSAHYHSSELMAIVANWYAWYKIEVRGWFFFEPGEAKSLVDSHHATVTAEERIINNREKSLNQPLREKNIRNCSKKNTENLQKRQKRNNPNE